MCRIDQPISSCISCLSCLALLIFSPRIPDPRPPFPDPYGERWT